MRNIQSWLILPSQRHADISALPNWVKENWYKELYKNHSHLASLQSLRNRSWQDYCNFQIMLLLLFLKLVKVFMKYILSLIIELLKKYFIIAYSEKEFISQGVTLEKFLWTDV